MAKVKVLYKGVSDVRILPQDQLEKRGVKGLSGDLEFNAQNRWQVEVEMSKELEDILRNDGAFNIQPVDDAGATTTTDVADPLQTSKDGVDDTGNTVVDGDTGQTEENKQPLADEAEAQEAAKAPLSSETGTTAGPDTNVATGRTR
jgi:hypothetical protein